MTCSGGLRVLVAGLLTLGVVLAGAGPGWAQQAAPPMAVPAAGLQAAPPDPAPWPLPTVAEDAPGRTILASVGAVVGSIVYFPFKLAGICPGMALAAGVHYAATLGKDTPVDEYLLRAGCAGTYFITPGMVRGQEEFQGSGTR